MLRTHARLPTPAPSSDRDVPSSPTKLLYKDGTLAHGDFATPPPSSPTAPRFRREPLAVPHDIASPFTHMPERSAAALEPAVARSPTKPVRAPMVHPLGTTAMRAIMLPADASQPVTLDFTHNFVVGRCKDVNRAMALSTQPRYMGTRPRVLLCLPVEAKHASRVHALLRWVPFAPDTAQEQGTFVVQIIGQNGLGVYGQRHRTGHIVRLLPGTVVLDFFGVQVPVIVPQAPARFAPTPAVQRPPASLGYSPTKMPQTAARDDVDEVPSSPPRFDDFGAMSAPAHPTSAPSTARMSMDNMARAPDARPEPRTAPKAKPWSLLGAGPQGRTVPVTTTVSVRRLPAAHAASRVPSAAPEAATVRQGQELTPSHDTAQVKRPVAEKRQAPCQPRALVASAPSSSAALSTPSMQAELRKTPAPCPTPASSAPATPRADTFKTDTPKADKPKPAAPKADVSKADKPTPAAPKADTPKADTLKADTLKADAPNVDTLEATVPMADARASAPEGAEAAPKAAAVPRKRSHDATPKPPSLLDEARTLVARLATTYDLAGLLAGAIVFHRTATISATEAVRSVLASNPSMMRGEGGAHVVEDTDAAEHNDPASRPAHGEQVAGWHHDGEARWAAAARQAWHERLDEELQSHDMFGVIQRPGKDTRGNPLECWYYYDKEHDHDRDRAQNLGAFVKPMRNVVRSQKPIFWKKSEYGRATSHLGAQDDLLPYNPRAHYVTDDTPATDALDEPEPTWDRHGDQAWGSSRPRKRRS